jgi:hypothetical protein
MVAENRDINTDLFGGVYHNCASWYGNLLAING